MITMKSWIEVATPHKDIRYGRLDESIFAADLSDVVAGRGPLEYCDAAIFFRKTYPTQGLLNLLSAVLGRLSGKGTGEAVIQIQTPFGGGKTHSLIALYHLFKHWQELSDLEAVGKILSKAGVQVVPQAAVVTFVGTAADALQGRAPWGEVAYQLGRYELLQEHDQKRHAPGKDLLHKLLGTNPTLILMDEIAEYAVKARNFRDQVVAFFQELTETVKVLPQAALVVTLPSSVPYGEEGERALYELQQIFGRVETVYTPVEGEEIFEVIRRRLFEDLGDPEEVRRTTEEFFEMYQRLGDDLPKEVREPTYRDRMRKAYPFHPELVDILFERWSTFPDFQRTRGVLRLLGQMVSELYGKNHQAPLILPAHLNLANPSVRGEFLRHIGNEYNGVIASDIAGSNAKAERIDREMGSEYTRFGVASGLARAIFFGSFSGSEKRGIGIQRLRLAVLQPGLYSAIVGDALRRLEEELWYLHAEGGVYWFSSQPNLNRIIVEKEEAVKPEQITREIQDRLKSLAGSEMRVTLWPQDSQDVPDTRELKLAILSPDYTRRSGETETFTRELLERCGQTFRVYRNTLLLLVADDGELTSAREKVKRYLALCAIRDDKALLRQLSEENRKTLESKLKDAESGINHQLLSAYRHLVKLGEQEKRWLDLGLPTVGGKPSIADRVREYLKSEDMLLDKIAPKRVLEKTFQENEKEKSVEEIHEAFLKYPHLPMLESKEVLLEAVAQGVRDGIFGVRIGDRTVFKEPLSPSQAGADTVVVRESKVVPSTSPPSSPPSPPPPSPGTVRVYELHASVPWDRLSGFVRGVLSPLRQDGAELYVEVIVRASSEGGIKQATIEQKVQETLEQIGARIIKEELR